MTAKVRCANVRKMRALVASALRATRRLKTAVLELIRTDAPIEAQRPLAGAVRELERLIWQYILYWCRWRTAVRCGYVGAILASVSVIHFYSNVREYPQHEEYKLTAEGMASVMIEQRIREGRYSHYQSEHDSLPACRDARRLSGEIIRIGKILLLAPTTAFIGSVLELRELDWVQWLINHGVRGNLGKWLDTHGAETATCSSLIATLPPGSRVPSGNLEDYIKVEMKDDPQGTDGCSAAEWHLWPYNYQDGNCPCGWARISPPRIESDHAQVSVKVEIKNWLHDDWRVDRIVRLSVTFIPPEGWTPAVRK